MPYEIYNYFHYFQIVTMKLKKPCAVFKRQATPFRRPIKYGHPKTCPVDYLSPSVIGTRIRSGLNVPGDATRDQNGDRWLPF